MRGELLFTLSAFPRLCFCVVSRRPFGVFCGFFWSSRSAYDMVVEFLLLLLLIHFFFRNPWYYFPRGSITGVVFVLPFRPLFGIVMGWLCFPHVGTYIFQVSPHVFWCSEYSFAVLASVLEGLFFGRDRWNSGFFYAIAPPLSASRMIFYSSGMCICVSAPSARSRGLSFPGGGFLKGIQALYRLVFAIVSIQFQFFRHF